MSDVPAVSTKEQSPKAPSAFLTTIRDQFSQDFAGDRDNWQEAATDLKFLALDQWADDVKKERDDEDRPWLTFDMIGEKINQITGDMRMNRPAIKVRPAEEGDEDLSEIFTGLIRHIEHQSDAQTAYTTAGISAARCGFGNWRVVTQYTDDESFEQEIRIQRMKNPFSVVWDSDSQELTREDAKRAWVLSSMSKAAFEAVYPKASLADFETDTPGKNVAWVQDWYKNDRIQVAEYWCKEPVKKTIALTPEGKSVDVTGKTMAEIGSIAVVDAAGKPRVREVKTHKVVQYIVNGAEVLDGPNEWAGKYIPIVPVWGEEIEIGETTKRFGVTRRAKDPQRIANYSVSAAVETLAQSPKAPFLGTIEQFAGLTKFWDNAHKKNYPYLPYNTDPKAPGPPQRSAPPTLNVAALELFRMAGEGIKAGMGIHDASVGARSNETSGKAILARQREGDVGSYTYVDNLSKAVAYCGRILVDLIPRIYDTERSIRILGEDGAQKFAKINSTVDKNGMPMPNGGLFNDISMGTYDVVVETGPSFSTKRAEAADTMMEFLKVAPNAAPLIMDLVVRNIDAAGADEMRKRLRKALPPGMVEPEEGEEPEPPPPPPPELVAQQQQAERDTALKAAEMELKGRELDIKAQELQFRTAELGVNAAQQRREHGAKVAEAQSKGMPAQHTDEDGNPMGQNPIEMMAAAVAQIGQTMTATAAASQAGTAEIGQALLMFMGGQAARDERMAAALVQEQQAAEMRLQSALQVLLETSRQQTAALLAGITAPRTSRIDRANGGMMTEVTTTIGNA